MQNLFVVIPVHNRKNLLRKCLRSFQIQTFRNFSIIVVNDGSTDGTKEMLKNEFPEVITLNGDGNLWWTGAINLGIRYALKRARNTDYVLVINDDLEIRDNYLQTLIELSAKHQNTLIGSVVVNITDPDVIINGGELRNFWTAKRRLINQGKKLSDFKQNYFVDVSVLTGRGTLIPVSVFNDIGLYDDKHFKQCGDIELPSRAKMKNYQLIISYDAVILSHTDSSYKMNTTHKYKLRDFSKVFFNVKSNNNIKYTYYNCRAATGNPFQLFVLFIFAFSRKLGRFLINLESL